MRVLHIGWGFKPWRGGGLIEYTEDLMDAQADNGWEVYYFFSCRHYPFKKTSLKVWKNKKVTMLEVLNSPIYHLGGMGTVHPQLDLSEPHTENIFKDVLRRVKPDIIHIQELAGLPSSVIDIAKDEFNIPLVMTLHDFFLLCPTLNLFNYKNQNCFKDQVGEDCVICCGNAYESLQKYQIYTLIYKVLEIVHLHETANKLLNRLRMRSTSLSNEQNQINRVKSQLYQKRRNINIKRLEKIDLLIAQSSRVEEIYKKFLSNPNIITLHSTVKHLELIKPKEIKAKHPIKFATLSGCYSIKKGSRLILETVRRLNDEGLGDLYEMHIWGEFDYQIKEIVEIPNVHYHGSYEIDQLDEILNQVDVGIIPSMLEEVYGYTGIEFLKKGIPIIGNAKGGITDYTINDLTGWVNSTASSLELVNIIKYILKNPEKIDTLNKKILNDKTLIKSMDTHFKEINGIYNRIIKA